MNDKRTPEMSGQEKMGVIDDKTPIGTIFEFDLVKGDIDPRTNSRREKGGEFTLRLTEKCPGSYMFSCPGCKHPVAATKEAWTERYAPAVTGVRWPEAKAVDGVKPTAAKADEAKPAAPPTGKADPEGNAGLREIPASPFANRPVGKVDRKHPRKHPGKPAAGPPPDDPAAANHPQLMLIPVAKIVREVDNCRGPIGEAKLAELADSIARVGLMHAIGVCERGNKYVLIAGHRRLAAIQRLKRPKIGAKVWHNLTNEQIAEMQFIENLQREDLTPIEEARGIAALVKAGQSIDTVASRIDRSQEFVRGRLDLLRLAEPIQELVGSGRIPLKHGRLIARIGDKTGQLRVAMSAMGSSSYWGQGVPSKASVKEAAGSDHISPLEQVRQSVTTQMQALGAARWPMDKRYAGKRECVGCPDNSATEPVLFDQITMPGKSKKGNCSNKPCFIAKFKAWEKDPVKKQRDKERAAKAKEKAKAGEQSPAAKGGKEDAELAARRKAFPSTPQEQYAVAMWEYGVAVGDKVLAFATEAKKLPADTLAIVLRIGLSEVGQEMWAKDPEKAEGVVKAIKGKAAVTVKRSLVVQVIDDAIVKGLRHGKPEWQSYMRQPENVPLCEVDLGAIGMVEALAKRWKVEINQTRPKAADFEKAEPEVVIATGKKPAALAAVKACTDKGLLKGLDAKGLRGDWRRAAVRGRIESLKKKPPKPAKKRVKASATAS